MNRNAFAAGVLIAASTCLAGTPQKWGDLPKPVRDTVLKNGGSDGMSVDLENARPGEVSTFEAGVKAADGTIHDLVISADGKLLETKTDDATDAAAEHVDRAFRLLKGVTFSQPRAIANRYLPLAGVTQDILTGTDEGKSVRVERTARPEIHKTFTVGGMKVDALAFEDRAIENGKLAEVAVDYFAQDDAGTVYYLGEDVDEYSDGKITGHSGSWLTGKSTPVPGVIFPAEPKMGLKWRSEDVSAEISETDIVVSMNETVTVPAGTYTSCVKVKEQTGDGETEYKFYAPGVGVVREMPANGDEQLTEHHTAAPK